MLVQFSLKASFVLVTIIAIVGHNNMVDERNVQQFGSLFYLVGQSVIFAAGALIARGVIVGKGNVCGIGQKRLFQHHAYVNHCACYAAAAH